jgi:hypothetical protein
MSRFPFITLLQKEIILTTLHIQLDCQRMLQTMLLLQFEVEMFLA